MSWEADDFKQTKTKTDILDTERCKALRVSGEQCIRRKTKSSPYCGTHCKNNPVSTDNDMLNSQQYHSVEVFAEEIQGIVYYIDKSNHVYNTEDIIQGRPNPRIIAKAHSVSSGDISIIDRLEWI